MNRLFICLLIPLTFIGDINIVKSFQHFLRSFPHNVGIITYNKLQQRFKQLKRLTSAFKSSIFAINNSASKMDNNNDIAISQLQERINILNQQADSLKFAIDILKSTANVTAVDTPKVDYQTNDKIKQSTPGKVSPAERVEMVKMAIEYLGKFSKLSTVVSYLGNQFDANQVRIVLGGLHDAGIVHKIKASTSNIDTFYGLTEWVKNGEVSPDKLYNKNEVVGSKLLDNKKGGN